MSQKLLHKRKYNGAGAPTVNQIEKGEIAVNGFAGSEKLYIKNSGNNIIPFPTEAQIDSKLSGKSNTGHTHPYAGWGGVTTNIDNVRGAKFFSAASGNKPKDVAYLNGITLPYRSINGGSTPDWSSQIAVATDDSPVKGVFYRGSNVSNWSSWHRLLDDSNSSVSKSGNTLTVKINGKTESLTNTEGYNTTYKISGSGSNTLTLTPSSGNATSVTVNNVSNATYASSAGSLKEANLSWGGGNHIASFGCIDAAMIPDLGANRMAFSKPAGVVIEYSNDGGSTWKDYGASDSQKTALTSTGTGLKIGKYTTSPSTSKDKLRVTFKTSEAGIYTALHKFAIYISTEGGQNCTCTIQKAIQSTPDKYITVIDKQSIGGWSGWNVINVPAITTYGNTPDSQYGRIRFIFESTGGGKDYKGLVVYKIMGFGGQGWTTPSYMADNGHLYTYDSSQNAIFPKTVKSSGFIKSGSNDNYVLTGGGDHKAISGLSVDHASTSNKASTITTVEGTSDVFRPLFFGYNGDNTKLTYDPSFKFNPNKNILSLPKGGRIDGAEGNLFIGNETNNGWVYVQDIASQLGSDKWKINQSGSAVFSSTATASGFVKTGSNNDYVLTGGGSHKAISGLSTNESAKLKEHIINGVDLDTLTGECKIYYAGGSNSNTNKPSGVDAFGLLTMKDANGYTAQLCSSSNQNPGLYFRTMSDGASGAWDKMATIDDIPTIPSKLPADGGNADTLDGRDSTEFLRYVSATGTNYDNSLWNKIGITEYDGCMPDGTKDVISPYVYSEVISIPSENVRFNLLCSHYSSSSDSLYFRSGWGGSKEPWSKIWSSNNFNPATKLDTSSIFTRNVGINGTDWSYYSPISTTSSPFMIYAPTGKGSSGQILKSSGGTTPVWTDASGITAGGAKIWYDTGGHPFKLKYTNTGTGETSTSYLACFTGDGNNISCIQPGRLSVKTANNALNLGDKSPSYYRQCYGSSGEAWFYVDGDLNTYYPVVIAATTYDYGGGFVSISRGYSDTAPENWNPELKTHHGGLTMMIYHNGSRYWDGNGSGDGRCTSILHLIETYTTLVGGIGNSTDGLVVWLRGGHAVYYIHSNNGSGVEATVHYDSFTDSAKQQFAPKTTPDTDSINKRRLFKFNIDGNSNYATNANYANSAGSATSATAADTVHMGAGSSNKYRNVWFNNDSTNEAVSGNVLPVSNTNFQYNPSNGDLKLTSVSASGSLYEGGTKLSDKYLPISYVKLYEANYSTDANTLPNMQVYFSEKQYAPNTPTNLGTLFSISETDTALQIFGDHEKNQFYIRNKWSTFGGWKKIYHSGNCNNIDTSWTCKQLNVINTHGGNASAIRDKSVDLKIGYGTDQYYAKISTIFESQNPDYLRPALAFYTMGSSHQAGSEIERMRISSRGFVGIGTAAPSEKLEVSGNIKASAFYESSDERLKNFESDIEIDFEKLKRIPKKYFHWKSGENKELQLGTSAQEVEKLYPEIVRKDNDGFMSVDYAKLSVVALKAVDELHKENEELKERLRKIEEKLGL